MGVVTITAKLQTGPEVSLLAYESIVGPHMSELNRYCLFLTGSPWDGEDLFQEALLKSLRYYASSGVITNARPFLFRVARNLWIDEYRQRGRKRIIAELEWEGEGRVEDVRYCEIRSWLEWAAAVLPDRQLVVWLLADYFGYTMNEIGRGLGITMSAVRSLLHRGRERLRSSHEEALDATSPHERNRGPVQEAMVRRAQSNDSEVLSNRIDVWVGCIMRDNPAALFRHAI